MHRTSPPCLQVSKAVHHMHCPPPQAASLFPEELVGANQYHCEYCGGKRDATRCACASGVHAEGKGCFPLAAASPFSTHMHIAGLSTVRLL